MSHHHPDAEMILAHAAGTLRGGVALVVATHVEGCAHCRRQAGEVEALGGAWIESIVPDTLRPDALARTLAQIDAASRPASAASVTVTADSSHLSHSRVLAQLPGDTPWPLSMQRCAITRDRKSVV